LIFFPNQSPNGWILFFSCNSSFKLTFSLLGQNSWNTYGAGLYPYVDSENSRCSFSILLPDLLDGGISALTPISQGAWGPAIRYGKWLDQRLRPCFHGLAAFPHFPFCQSPMSFWIEMKREISAHLFAWKRIVKPGLPSGSCWIRLWHQGLSSPPPYRTGFIRYTFPEQGSQQVYASDWGGPLGPSVLLMVELIQVNSKYASGVIWSKMALPSEDLTIHPSYFEFKLIAIRYHQRGGRQVGISFLILPDQGQRLRSTLTFDNACRSSFSMKVGFPTSVLPSPCLICKRN